MNINKQKLSGVLIGIMLISLLGGCGKEEEEAYSSPSFIKPKSDTATVSDATINDPDIERALMIASYSDATMSDAEAIPASNGNALLMGVYEGNTYYNSLAGFKLAVDGRTWKLYDAVELASATGATEDHINNLWYGYNSPYDEKTSYAAIACDTETGSSIIVSYINPDKYLMPDFDAYEYLNMAAKKYEDVNVTRVTFLAQRYACLDIPEEQSNVGKRVQFAIDRDGLIILITFTLSDEKKLEDAVQLLSPFSN